MSIKDPIGKKEEKRVEYLELIYDLIFVYVLGRNNSLLHEVENGFVPTGLFIAYILGSLVAVQIWMFSSYYINMFGRNKARDHVFLLINMYLMYYIAEGTRLHWTGYVKQYYIAWALILVNICVQYLIESRNHERGSQVWKFARLMAAVLFGEALIVLSELWLFERLGASVAAAAILFGIVGTVLIGVRNKGGSVDFAHLSERAMLYVVFTFGEMVIAIASYFEVEFNLNAVYFSLMAFLIVVGLFLSYGTLYNDIVDKELRTNGMGYMLIHIFLIFALNDITTALEFMRNDSVALMPKMVFLILSFVLCYVCMLSLGRFSGQKMGMPKRVLLRLVAIGASFVVLMAVFRTDMRMNIAVTVAYVFGIFLFLRHYGGHLAERRSRERG